MFKTGVFCTEKERKTIRELMESARDTPAIEIGGIDLSHEAHKELFHALYACAFKHGLPEIPGEYELTEEGEFVTVDGQGPTPSMKEKE